MLQAQMVALSGPMLEQIAAKLIKISEMLTRKAN